MSARLESLAAQFKGRQSRLQQWREKYPLSRTHIRNVLYSQKYSKLIDAVFDVMIQNPQIFKHSNLEEFNRKQQRQSAAQMTLAMHKLRPISPSADNPDMHSVSIVAHALYHFDPGFCVKCDITYFLYGKTLYNFASDNPVQQRIMRDAMSYKHIGCFGLTQLGHGSNVKGILTRATYDHNTKQFVMHSPCKQAMKFWIGASAQLATMAAIWAQLVIDGVQYGPHPFIVPIRDPKTHTVFKGVTIGDCGHKNGANNIDNGYILFQNYRIPKDYGLNRLSGVDQNGKFFFKTKSPGKLFGLYMGPLSIGRAFVACNPIGQSFSCLAIAVRFACTRRQFSMEPGKKQELLIDYPAMKYRIMPNIAQAFVYFFGGINLLKTYDLNLKELLYPGSKLINQLHAITGPCKAKASWFASQVITECRQICGGHGYSAYSGFSRIYHGQDINTSWQGDNNMLLQQTTKYILKTLNKLNKGLTFENNNLEFLSQTIEVQENPDKKHLYDLDYLEKVVKIRIRDLSQECIGIMVEQKAQGKDGADIWNSAQPHFGNALSSAFGDLYYLKHIKSVISKLEPAWKEVAENCTRLWMFNLLLEWKWSTKEVRKLIQASVLELVDWLTPYSVSITDGFAAPSQIIGSVFADQKGQGMKNYVTKLFTGKKVFEPVPWSNSVVNLRNSN